MARDNNKLPSASWLKNAGKSIAFSSIEVLKNITPTTSGIGSSAIEGAKGLRELKQTAESSTVKKFASDILKTAMDDIKTGNFSLEKNTDDLFGSMNDLDDWDVMDDEDDGDLVSEVSEGDKLIGKAVLVGNATTVDSLKQVSETISRTQLKSAEYISHRISNVSISGFNTLNTTMKGVNNRLDIINENLVQMMRFQNENVSVTNQAMLDFFDKSLETTERLGKYLEPSRDRKNYPRSTDMGFMSGGFDGSGYTSMVKKNFSNSMVGSMLGLSGSLMGMSDIMGTPRLPKFLLEAGLGALIPKKIKKSAGKMDKNMNTYIENMLYRVGDASTEYGGNNNMLTRFLGELLGAKRPTSQRISLGNINKESMGWNGTAQQYLVEVIPSYLAKIEANTSNSKDSRYYDIEEGTFKKGSKLKKDFYDDRKFNIENDFYDIVEKLNKTLENNNVALEDSVKIKDTIDSLVNDRLSGDMGYSKDYRTKLTGALGSVIPQDSFKEIVTMVEKSISDSIKSMNRQVNEVANESSSAVYRNLFNDGQRLEKLPKMKLFNNTDSVGSYNPIDAKDEILSIAMDIPEYHELKNFKIDSSFIREFVEARSKEVFSNGEYTLPLVKKEIYRQLVSEKGKSAFGKTRNTISNKFKNSGFGRRIGSINDGISNSLEGIDQFAFENLMGFKPDKATKSETKDEARVVVAATSRATTNSPSGNIMKNIQNSILTKKEEIFKKENYDKIIKKSGSQLDKELEDNKALINEANRLSRNEATMSSEPMDAVQATMNAADSIRVSSLGMFSTFTGIVSKLFGNDGFFAKVMSDDKVKEFGNTIKEALFNEETGTFNKATKSFLDGVDHLKYSFTGKAYTDRKGVSYKEGENDSVFSNAKKGYDFTVDNTMKYLFNGDNYKENETYKKYFSWTDKNKKDGMNTQSSDEAIIEDSINIEDILQTDIINPKVTDKKMSRRQRRRASGSNRKNTNIADPITEAIIDTSDKIKESGEEFTEVLFGENDIPKEKKESEFFRNFKSSMGKHLTGAIAGAGVSIATGGSLGLLGGLFLPTNPIGGAIAGMGISMISRNAKFQEMIFGKEDEDGVKTGGLISKKLQDNFKKALPTMVGGAVLGTLKRTIFGAPSGGLGVMTGMLLPGGPLGGAMLGMATSLVLGNSKIKQILFGEKDEDGKSIGGMLSKGMNTASETLVKAKPYLSRGLKGLGIGALTGATLSQMGFIGSALSLGGPVGMGIAGLGLGIASSSSRFNELMFGTEEIGEDGQPTGRRIKDGWVNQMRNSFVVNIADPVKAKIEGEATKFAYWAKEKIEFPFRQAFGPILDALGGLKDDISDFVKDQFEMVTRGIGSVFSTFMNKLLSPITKTVGFIADKAIGAVSVGAKIATMPLVGGLKLASMAMAPARTKEEINFWKNYTSSAKESLSQTWDANPETSIFGKAQDILFTLTNKDLKDDARQKYSEAMGLEGRNSLDHRGVKAERKALRTDKKKSMADLNQWKKIDKLRGEYAKEDGNKEVFWTDKTLQDRRKELIKKGLPAEFLQTETDIKQLIFNKDDWRNRLDGKNIESEAGLGKGSILNESEDMKDARRDTSKYQGRMLDIAETMKDLMFKSAGTQVASERSDKQEDRYRKKMKKFKVKPNELSLENDDLNEFSKMASWEWDLYKQSPEYSKRDFKGWIKRTSNKDNAIVNGEGVTNTTPRTKDIVNSISDMSREVVDRLDSQNEVLYGGEYDRTSRKFSTGRPMDKETIDRAHLSEDEMNASNIKSSSNLLSKLFGHKAKEERRRERAIKEEEESKQSQSLGDMILNGITPKKEEDPEDSATIVREDNNTGKSTGVIQKVTSSVDKVFGGVADWFSDSGNITKLVLLSGGLNLVKTKFPEFYDNVMGALTETIIPSIGNFAKNNVPGFIKKSSEIIAEVAPDMIRTSAEVLVTLMPALIESSVTVMTALGTELKDIVMEKIFGTSTKKIESPEDMEKAVKAGLHTSENEFGETVILGSTIDKVNGKTTKINDGRLTSAGLHVARSSIVYPKAFKAMANIGGSALGGGIGMSTTLIPGIGGIGNTAIGAKVGGSAGKTLAKGVAKVTSGSKEKVIKFTKVFFEKLRKFGTDDSILKIYKKLPDNGFKTFIGSLESNISKAVASMSDEMAEKAAAKAANATAEASVKTATGISPATLVFLGYDAITGAFEADRLFGIAKDAVDWLMRIISSTFKAFLGAWFMPIFDVILEIMAMATGTDPKRHFATEAYKALSKLGGASTEDNINALEKNQKSMDTERKEYNETNQTNLNSRAYIDKQNPSFLRRLFSKPESTSMDNATYTSTPTPMDTITRIGGTSRYMGGISYGPAQDDPRWSGFELGILPNGKKSTMGIGGCGPTALASITNTNPLSVAKMAKDEGYLKYGGSTDRLFKEGARKLGLEPRDVTQQGLEGALASGKPMLISGKSGNDNNTPFTRAGHVLSILGKDSNGNAIIQDPKDGRRKVVGIDILKKGMTSAWQYDKANTSYGPANMYTDILGAGNVLDDMRITKMPDLSTTHFSSSIRTKGGGTRGIDSPGSGGTRGETDNSAIIQDESFFDKITDSSLFSGASGLLGGLSDMLSKVAAVGTKMIGGLLSGDKYSRILDDDGNFLSGEGGLISSLLGSSGTKNQVQLSGNKKEFIDTLLPYALKAAEQHGVSPSVLLAQAAIETGWGTKVKSNNFFGIKGGGVWKGKTTTFNTSEYENGVKISTKGKFRAYDTIEESVMDYARLMGVQNYRKVKNAPNYKVAAYELKNAGYATDPNYPNLLIDIVRQNGLDYWDNPTNRNKYLSSSKTTNDNLAFGPLDDISAFDSAGLIDQMAKVEEAKIEMKLGGLSYNEAKQVVESRRSNQSTSSAGSPYMQSSSSGYTSTPGSVKGLMNQSSMDIKNWFTKSLNSRVSSEYGMRSHPIFKTRKKHTGLDFAAKGGTGIPSPVDGTIISTIPDGSYGNKVLLKDKLGLYHLFAHLQERPPLPNNTLISKGQIIGRVGTTGSSTGNHLHYEVRKSSAYGTDINPSTYKLNSIIEGYGGMDLSDESISKLNISRGFSKTYDTTENDSGRDIQMNSKDMIEKLEIVAKTEGVENKLDVIIDIMKDGVKKVAKNTPKENISYGDTIINNSNNSKSQRPIILAPPKNNGEEKSDNSLRSLHEFIAKGR